MQHENIVTAEMEATESHCVERCGNKILQIWCCLNINFQLLTNLVVKDNYIRLSAFILDKGKKIIFTLHCPIHGFIPDSILSVAIVPIINDKTGKIGAKSNYTPVALASVVPKVIEIVILNCVKNLLSSTCNQFGFKASVVSD